MKRVLISLEKNEAALLSFMLRWVIAIGTDQGILEQSKTDIGPVRARELRDRIDKAVREQCD